MNNNFKTLALALAACAAMTGTALAAPKGNPPPRGKAPTAMKAPAHKGHAPARPAAHNTHHNTHQFAHTRPCKKSPPFQAGISCILRIVYCRFYFFSSSSLRGIETITL